MAVVNVSTSLISVFSSIKRCTESYHPSPKPVDPSRRQQQQQGIEKDYRIDIIARLRGQEIHVPDVSYIYAGWDVKVHPDVGELRQHLEGYFEKYISTESQRKKQKKVDNALCVGHFWTDVEKNKFAVLGELVAWFFFWDDEIDCGILTNDRDKTEAYCDDTLKFIKSCLQPELGGEVPAPGRLHNCGPWEGIGRAMQEGQSKEARDRFAASIYGFITGVRTSQATWAVGMSTFSEYTTRRLKTVGTDPCIAVMQWAYGLSLPPRIWDHEATKAITREVAIGCFVWNDIVSLKKEIVDGDVDSTIPVLVWNEGISAQEAVDRCVKMAEESWGRLLEAEKRLIGVHIGETEQIKRDIEVFIGGAKDVLVGHMLYSLLIPRNMKGARMGELDSSFKVVL
ncbi:terpenoid synthase [Clathrospora elynae]|uniref:Terpene synthase n=1 Tax=Clathrospora elynae TaxID=706981 RepID=A0A6A5SUW6_9PLEO|nr:terpenoid synthase [Clathrospora elynae]